MAFSLYNTESSIEKKPTVRYNINIEVFTRALLPVLTRLLYNRHRYERNRNSFGSFSLFSGVDAKVGKPNSDDAATDSILRCNVD